jgi:23S rRNA (guanosine2251-2'-O)-methyltransferase
MAADTANWAGNKTDHPLLFLQMFTKKTMAELGRFSAGDMKAQQKHPVLVILDDVRSMHNVGSAFRTCDAFAVAGIFLCGYTPAPPHRDIHKTALGATETVAWQHFTHTGDAIAAARQQGYRVYAVEQTHNSTALSDLKWDKQTPLALVFGNEVNGVSETALAEADLAIEIPQWGSKHSLNISVSLGIVIWELIK